MVPRGDCAIWDIAVFSNGGQTQVVAAEDSGKVRVVDPRNNA